MLSDACIQAQGQSFASSGMLSRLCRNLPSVTEILSEAHKLIPRLQQPAREITCSHASGHLQRLMCVQPAQGRPQPGYSRLDSPARFMDCAICAEEAASPGSRSPSRESPQRALEGRRNPQGLLEGPEASHMQRHGSPDRMDVEGRHHQNGSLDASTVRQDSVRLLDCTSGELLDAYHLLPGDAHQALGAPQYRQLM